MQPLNIAIRHADPKGRCSATCQLLYQEGDLHVDYVVSDCPKCVLITPPSSPNAQHPGAISLPTTASPFSPAPLTCCLPAKNHLRGVRGAVQLNLAAGI